ncbi:hypothetical protein BC829DRAFT_394406 [Chytridium lagenaria]|nr:hypothetical protein BC829DRAFT_394406 [Chytridium lagenaria]
MASTTTIFQLTTTTLVTTTMALPPATSVSSSSDTFLIIGIALLILFFVFFTLFFMCRSNSKCLDLQAVDGPASRFADVEAAMYNGGAATGGLGGRRMIQGWVVAERAASRSDRVRRVMTLPKYVETEEVENDSVEPPAYVV